MDEADNGHMKNEKNLEGFDGQTWNGDNLEDVR